MYNTWIAKKYEMRSCTNCGKRLSSPVNRSLTVRLNYYDHYFCSGVCQRFWVRYVEGTGLGVQKTNKKWTQV
jgi:hypothetical protein